MNLEFRCQRTFSKVTVPELRTEIKKNHNILIFYFTVSDNPVNLIYSTLNFKMIPLDIMSGGFDIVSSLTWGYF